MDGEEPRHGPAVDGGPVEEPRHGPAMDGGPVEGPRHGPAMDGGPVEGPRHGPAVDGGPVEGPDEQLPLLPGFREIALRRMAAQRRRLVTELAAERQAAQLSQTEVAARMGTSQSAVARLESGEADARASTLERYAAAIGRQITWELRGAAPGARREDAPADG